MKLLRVMTSSGSLGLIDGQPKFLSKEGGIDITLAAGGEEELLQGVAKKYDVDCYYLPHLVRPISIVNDFKALCEMIRMMRRQRPDIVHANTPKGSLIAMIAAWVCRVPHRVYTVSGLRFEGAGGKSRWLLKTMERITCACANKVIPEGQGVLNTLKRERITRKPLSVIHNGNINGIDLDHFRETPELQSKAQEIRRLIGGDTIFIAIGRIVGDKGINELVEAFDQLSDPDSRLILVGPYEKIDPITLKNLQTIESSPQIYEAGWQDDVRPWLLAGDIFVHASYREGFPNVVMQAGAMGLPSIVTNINGSNEIIIPNQNGVIVPPKNSDALYNAMKTLLEDKELRRQLASNARELIVSRYNQRDVWRAILQEYQRLFAKS